MVHVSGGFRDVIRKGWPRKATESNEAASSGLPSPVCPFAGFPLRLLFPLSSLRFLLPLLLRLISLFLFHFLPCCFSSFYCYSQFRASFVRSILSLFFPFPSLFSFLLCLFIFFLFLSSSTSYPGLPSPVPRLHYLVYFPKPVFSSPFTLSFFCSCNIAS